MSVTVTGWIHDDESHLIENTTAVALTDETHALLKQYFAEEVGLNVRRVGMLATCRKLVIPAGQQSMFVRFSTFPPSVRKATFEQCVSVVQRDSVCLIKFQFDDGPRLVATHTFPVALPVRIFELGVLGPGIVMGPPPDEDAPCEFLINICMLDPYTCFNCGKTDVNMPSCKRCKEVGTATRYCSKACQTAHRAVHKPFCGKV